MKPYIQYPKRPVEPADTSKVFLGYFSETTRRLIENKLQLDEGQKLIFTTEGSGYYAYIVDASYEENAKTHKHSYELALQQYYIDMAKYNIQFNEKLVEDYLQKLEKLKQETI
jgi:hypothetical protein